MTRFQAFVQRWANGCGSGQCATARKVFCRGDLPADVAFVGEGPGESENVLGKPFCGPAGKLLDQIARNGLRGTLCTVCGRYQSLVPPTVSSTTSGPQIQYLRVCPNGHEGDPGRPIRAVYCNVVACIARNEDGKADEPEDDQVVACTPRLQEFIELANPRLIFAVGNVSQGWLMPGFKHTIHFHRPLAHIVPKDIDDSWYREFIRLVPMLHPAAILKGPVTAREVRIQECQVTVSNAVEDL